VSTPSRAQRRKEIGVAGHTGDIATARRGLLDHDGTVRVAALRALERLHELTDIEIAASLADDAPGVRIAALELAAGRTSPPLAFLLADTDPMVVESACWALGERAAHEPAVIDALAAVAGDHDDPLAREAAVAALGAIGDERGLPAVLAACSDKPAIRRRAVISLVAFEGPDVDAAWTRARDDRDRQVRDAVEELLGPLDD